ncbi:MAG: hypothetical protein CMJ29_13090 [Phycisphaerae bacterium]|nr:hypothetical protein [Phycisphaerae bacterium]
MLVVWIIGCLGAIAWIGLSAMIMAACRHVRSLPRGHAKQSTTTSVICPARDEADAIEAAVRSRLRDPARWIDFILINDRSTDRTGELIDAMAREDDRVKVIHVHDLPDGWLGKVHAQQQGTEQAAGEWLLFSDADVHVEPGLVENAIAWAEDQEADHVALVPRIEGGPLIMRMCLPVLMLVLVSTLRLWRANDDAHERAMGVGAFNLVRRDALERAGGMESLKMEIADDVGVGTIIQQSGGRSRLAVASDRLWVTWYRTRRDFLKGMEKGAAKFGHRPRLLLQSMLVLLLCLSVLSPYILLTLWPMLPLPVALIALSASVLGIITTLASSIRFALPREWAAMVPVGLIVTLFVGQRSIWKAIIKGRVDWKGDDHTLHSAQAGARVKL